MASNICKLRLVICGALFAVAGHNVPVVASCAFHAFAAFVIAFSLARVFADLAVKLYHEFTFFRYGG